ncbi:hypothetical protein HYW36_02640 [Candidatus Saccharibacteria bacterium]|nr:hypothetical protein [Candidatus Saccharibacteria bacterium]
MAEIILLSIVVLPLLCTFFLKSNGALTFLTVCVGYVLVSLASNDLENFLSDSGINSLDLQLTDLILVFGPVLLTMLLTRKALSNQFKFLMHLIAAACAGGLMALITAPFLASTSTVDIFDTWTWASLQKIQTVVIVIGALVSLSLIWSGGLKNRFRHHK